MSRSHPFRFQVRDHVIITDIPRAKPHTGTLARIRAPTETACAVPLLSGSTRASLPVASEAEPGPP
eukprot:3053487-Rhodomonas_salina.2